MRHIMAQFLCIGVCIKIKWIDQCHPMHSARLSLQAKTRSGASLQQHLHPIQQVLSCPSHAHRHKPSLSDKLNPLHQAVPYMDVLIRLAQTPQENQMGAVYERLANITNIIRIRKFIDKTKCPLHNQQIFILP